MAWIILVLSGVLEAIWASALGASENFKRRTPTVVFIFTLPASVAGLAFAMAAIPVGTAYAVWVGIGAVLTVLIAVARRVEALTLTKGFLLTLLIGSVIGLKVVG